MIRTFAALSVLLGANAAQAIVVDGSYDAAYGAPTALVTYNPAAATGNFGAPTSASNAVAYTVHLAASNGGVYGFMRLDPATGGTSTGPFTNVYFDIDPANGNGSDIGFELGYTAGSMVQNFFIPGRPGSQAATGVINAMSADGMGFEFLIPNSYFTTVLSGANYYPGQTFAVVGGPVTLRLSQSFGYSVAGGSSYGPARLGSVGLAAAVPEPATWGLLIVGFGMVGTMARRRRPSLAA